MSPSNCVKTYNHRRDLSGEGTLLGLLSPPCRVCFDVDNKLGFSDDLPFPLSSGYSKRLFCFACDQDGATSDCGFDDVIALDTPLPQKVSGVVLSIAVILRTRSVRFGEEFGDAELCWCERRS